VKYCRRCLRCRFGKEEFGQFGRLELATAASDGLPQQRDIDFGLASMNLAQDALRDLWEFTLRGCAMHNGDPVAVHAEMTAPGIDNLKAITFLLPDESRPQLIVVEEFNDLTFKEHEKISFSDRD
jgi:hypothetical protein